MEQINVLKNLANGPTLKDKGSEACGEVSAVSVREYRTSVKQEVDLLINLLNL